jgi:hypothetical protein
MRPLLVAVFLVLITMFLGMPLNPLILLSMGMFVSMMVVTMFVVVMFCLATDR